MARIPATASDDRQSHRRLPAPGSRKYPVHRAPVYERPGGVDRCKGWAPSADLPNGLVSHNQAVSEYSASDETRIDRWLCAVRLVKTRPIATQLCEGGHVRVNGNAAKPSTKVRAGDVVHALIAGRERIVEIVRPIETRVGAPVAATCYVDNSPPPVISELAPGIKVVRGEGRPNKRLRRELERMKRIAGLGG